MLNWSLKMLLPLLRSFLNSIMYHNPCLISNMDLNVFMSPNCYQLCFTFIICILTKYKEWNHILGGTEDSSRTKTRHCSLSSHQFCYSQVSLLWIREKNVHKESSTFVEGFLLERSDLESSVRPLELTLVDPWGSFCVSGYYKNH